MWAIMGPFLWVARKLIGSKNVPKSSPLYPLSSSLPFQFSCSFFFRLLLSLLTVPTSRVILLFAVRSSAMPSGYASFPSTSSGTDIFTLNKSRTLSFFATRRPWPELLSHPSSYSLPYPLRELASRLRRNLNYFRVNYSIIILFVLFLSLLWHPISMIVYLIVFVAWWFLYLGREEPIVVLNRMVDDRLVLATLGIVTIACLVLTRVWLNVLVSISIGVGIIVLHAAFRSTEDLFLDEDEAAEGGLVSVVDNTARFPSGAGYTNPF